MLPRHALGVQAGVQEHMRGGAMSNVVAVYNMKGGVGKTTTALNLSYLAAAAGRRALLWDLDPQAASSFALRVRPHVHGFGKKSLEDGETLIASIKETDYPNLDLLPADFAYRKFDRLIDHIGKPERVVAGLLDALRRDYDIVFLDCPAGFSLLTQGIFASADGVLVPTLPAVLSLRMVARLIKWADRSDSRAELAAFFSMVDRRKMLHRRVYEWSAGHPDVFLSAQIPYASVVEQMPVRRMPLPAFAERDAATCAFAALWSELETRLERREGESEESEAPARDKWRRLLEVVKSLIRRLEAADVREDEASRQPLGPGTGVTRPAPRSHDARPIKRAAGSTNGDVNFVHRFDTDGRDLQRCGYVLELREQPDSLVVAVARSSPADQLDDSIGKAEVQIDGCSATQILSGEISPLEVIERRMGASAPWLIEPVRAAAGGQNLRRIASVVATARPSRALLRNRAGDR
jgi:chromosome partitioning protein